MKRFNYTPLKGWLISFGLLAVLFIVLNVRLYVSNRSYEFLGVRLQLESVDAYGVTMTDGDGGRLVMTVEPPGYAAAESRVHTVNYLDMVITREFSRETERIYTFSDGSRWVQGGGEPLTELQMAERHLLFQLMDFHFAERPISEYITFAAVGLLVILLGLGVAFFPNAPSKALAFVLRRDKATKPQSPQSNRIFGVVIAGLAFIMLFIAL